MARRQMNTAFMGAPLLSIVLTGCATNGKCGIEGCPGDAAITAKVQAALDQRADFGPPGNDQRADSEPRRLLIGQRQR